MCKITINVFLRPEFIDNNTYIATQNHVSNNFYLEYYFADLNMIS